MSDMKLIDTITEIITHGIMDESASTNIAINVAAAARSHYVPEGYCVVPVEPTLSMTTAGTIAQELHSGLVRSIWQAMIAAGRKP